MVRSHLLELNLYLHIILPHRVRQRPSSQDPDVVSLMLLGKVDGDELVKDPTALVDELHAVIGRRDIKFGEVIWCSKYRCVCSFPRTALKY